MRLLLFDEINSKAKVYINPEQVTAVQQAGNGETCIVTSSGDEYFVAGDASDAVYRLYNDE